MADGKTWEEKREFCATHSFEDVCKAGMLPATDDYDAAVANDQEYNYFVVSYSREDSEKVLPDIYTLQAEGFHIWYDQGIVDRMSFNNNWKKIVREMIHNPRCRGVLFYLSENFVLSSSCEEEVHMVQEAEKPHVEVILPVEINRKYRGQYFQAGALVGMARKYYGAELLEELQCSEARQKFYCEVFPDESHFLKYGGHTEDLVRGLTSIKKTTLFEFRRNASAMALAAVNDLGITEANVPEIAEEERSGEWREVSAINECAFANCRFLKRVNLPDTIECISEYAFFHCRQLESINFPKELVTIRQHAFSGCRSLREIKLKNVTCLEKWAFEGCTDLEWVVLSDNMKKIGDYAFADCTSLEKIKLPNELERIGAMAFGGCTALNRVRFENCIRVIREYAFAGCGALTELYFPESLIFIGEMAFADCNNLKKVVFLDAKNWTTNEGEPVDLSDPVQAAYLLRSGIALTKGKVVEK